MVKGPLTVTDMVCWHVGHGHGPLRREAAAPRLRRTGSGSRASSTATSSNVPDVMQRVHWDPGVRPPVGQPDDLRLRPHARDLAHPPLHRLDGRRRLALEARLRVPPVQLRRRHAVAARARSTRKYLRRGRPARGRPRARGREPARRGHHARARHDPAAEPRARPGAPARPARRRHRPRRARSTPSPTQFAATSERRDDLRIGRRPRGRARRRRAAARRSTGPRSATRSTTR